MCYKPIACAYGKDLSANLDLPKSEHRASVVINQITTVQTTFNAFSS